MDPKINKKRDLAAAKTRKKILQAACVLFVKSGFEGVSISEIAKKAGVNQSLIYHYYASKEELWKNVKSHFVEAYVNSNDLVFDVTKGLKLILEQIVYSRFEFYGKHPEIIRMMGWQRLEASKERLAGGTLFSPDNWKEVFSQLQKKGEIRKDIDLDMMIFFISSVITGALTEDLQNKFKVQKNKVLYLEMTVNCFMLSFGS